MERWEFERMKDEYYQLRGWDMASGLQKSSRLVELGLDFVVSELAQKGLVIME